MREYIEKAKVLVEALPYIKEFNGITVVIKYGGSALVNQEIKESVIKDIALMKFVGFKPVVVHGGGSEINSMLKRLRIESRFENGLRVTDEQTMEVVEMVLTGKLNKEITTDLSLHGILAAGISGKDGRSIQVERYMPNGTDIGLVGAIKNIDTMLMRTLINNDFVPVISPVGVDENGVGYNVNADTAAVAIAGALNAEKLVFLTDVEGILRDRRDASSVYSRVKAAKLPQMIEKGIISGGMIPKVE
ncbi:MAG: acetylglutamate kinase, partial [Clostridiales bacterium]|nr:acetylglutamate kinase [Clostridiales bacterium]